MKAAASKAQHETHTIDEYIAAYPRDVQKVLKVVRATIRKAAPDADETIRYRIPTFRLNGNLVHFAAFKHHIGLYPPVQGPKSLLKKLAPYAGPKGNLQFPLDEPMPLELIREVVRARVKEDAALAATRKKK